MDEEDDHLKEARKFVYRMLGIQFVAVPLAAISLALVAYILLPTWAVLALGFSVGAISTVVGIVVIFRIRQARREAERSN